jgi:pimeloyl-ACP methyl ester carboxylesterase
MDTQDMFINTDQGRLFARRWQPGAPGSDKAPILLLHDSLGCVALWRTFPAALSQATGRIVIAYDRLGFGQSAPHSGRQRYDFIHREAEIIFPMLCQQLHIDQFIAFGHSVGGGIAVHCAGRYPEACQAVITESAQAFVEERTLNGIRDARKAFARSANVARLERYHGDKAQWVLDAWIDTWLSLEFSDWSLEEVLTQVRSPLLAIHGDQDEYGSVHNPEFICQHAGGQSTLKVLPGLRHVPHREDEGAVVELVAQFLAGALV